MKKSYSWSTLLVNLDNLKHLTVVNALINKNERLTGRIIEYDS